MADQMCMALLLLILATAAACEPAVCNATYPLISGDRFRLLDSSLSASSYLDSSHKASDARLLRPGSRGWCFGDLLSIEPQWLEIAFPARVVISAISTAGSTNAYTVLYGADNRDALETYREPGSATAKIFNVSGLDSANGSTNASLYEPLVLKRLRIYPYSWSANPACLLVEVYGCLLKPACDHEVNLYTASDVLPSSNIVSSSGEGVPQLLQEDSYVCFPFTAESSLPFITLNFTQPTYITRAETLFPIHLADNTNVYETFVDRYTIEVSTDGNNFTMYTLADGTKEIGTDKVNTFWEPVRIVRYLRLTMTAVQAAFGQVCWHIHLFGCTASQGYNSSEVDPQLDLSTADPHLSSSISPTLSPSPLISMPALTDSYGDNVRKDYLVVEIVLPVAGLTVLVVVTVCVIGVAFCAQLKRTADYKLKLLTPPSGPIRYGRESPALTGHMTGPSLYGQEQTIKVVRNTLYRTDEGNPIEDSGVALSHNLSYEAIHLGAEAGARNLTRISENYEVSALGLDICEAVSEGYEPVGTGLSPPEPPADLHDYDSIRLSQLYAPVSVGGWTAGRGVVHPPVSQTVSGQSSSEYEMMESVQCLEDSHVNRPLAAGDP